MKLALKVENQDRPKGSWNQDCGTVQREMYPKQASYIRWAEVVGYTAGLCCVEAMREGEKAKE